MLTLKRFSILTILSLGLLVSQSALAGTEDISEDWICKKETRRL